MFNADKTLGSNRWPVVRLRGGGRTEVVLLSTRFFCLTTHWSKFTVPCCGDHCSLCEILPGRGLFYLAVLNNSRVSILELGSQSASSFEQHAKFAGGGMKVGLVFELSRMGDKKPVRSEIIREDGKGSEVPQLDLAAHVMALYKFPPPNPGEEIVAYSERCAKIAKLRCDRCAEQLAAKSNLKR